MGDRSASGPRTAWPPWSPVAFPRHPWATVADSQARPSTPTARSGRWRRGAGSCGCRPCYAAFALRAGEVGRQAVDGRGTVRDRVLHPSRAASERQAAAAAPGSASARFVHVETERWSNQISASTAASCLPRPRISGNEPCGLLRATQAHRPRRGPRRSGRAPRDIVRDLPQTHGGSTAPPGWEYWQPARRRTARSVSIAAAVSSRAGRGPIGRVMARSNPPVSRGRPPEIYKQTARRRWADAMTTR